MQADLPKTVNEAVKILAPDKTVRIPNIICNKIINPKIITDLNR